MTDQRIDLPETAHDRLRVLIVTDAFMPHVNGVTNSVRHVLDHLAAEGHVAAVIAPTGPETYAGFPVITTRTLPLRSKSFKLGIASLRLLRAVMTDFSPDVVHVAAPVLLGYQALRTTQRLRIPSVATYQTDLAGFAKRYPLPGGSAAAGSVIAAIHRKADLNLAPSTASLAQLRRLGIENVGRWTRGVDLDLFSPTRRSESLHAELAPDGEQLVGYVGRLAPEKELDQLAHLDRLDGVRLVVVGAGSQETRLRRLLPRAAFLGLLHDQELATAYATLDVFVHTGRHETYGQAPQEALASGVPVVAPRSGGPIDVVQHGTGFLYEPGNADELARHVRNLVEQPLLRNRMALAARRSVGDRSWKHVNDALVASYRATIAARSTPGAAVLGSRT